MRLSRAVTVIAAIAFGIGAPLGAGAAASSSGVSPGTGEVSGTVTGHDGAPVVGACVELHAWPTATTHTAADGTFTFAGVIASGIDSETIDVDASCGSGPYAHDYEPYSSTPFDVIEGKTTTVNVGLTLGGSIRGQVLDADGAALQHACVGAYPIDTPWEAYGYSQSDADGTFELNGIPPGTYDVQIDGCYSGEYSGPDIQPEYYDEASVNGTQTQGFTRLLIEPGDEPLLSSQRTRPGADILIRVTDPSGNLIPGVSPDIIPLSPMTVLNSWGNLTAPDANGYWRIRNLLPGQYEIGYWYCGDPAPRVCRSGYIGFFQGIGLEGIPGFTTGIPTLGGQTTSLSDTVSVPPLIATSTVVTADDLSPQPNQVLILHAQVTAASGTHIPTGNVYFSELVDTSEGTKALGMSNIDTTGLATLFWTADAGDHTIVATYAGDGGTAVSSGQLVLHVGTSTSGGGSSGGGSSGGGGASPAPSPVTGTVPAGGSLWSDPVGTTPDASNPLVVGITSPTAGDVTIDKTPPDTEISQYRVLNVGATITAPAASTSKPLQLSFQVFDGKLPAGSYSSDLTVFRDGVAVVPCATPGTVSPDPCVTSSGTHDGVTTIDILSSHASTWDVEAADVGRIGGADRIATAVAVSRDSFPAGNAGAVVLARADDYPDALVGAPLAVAKNAPMLLTQGSSLPQATAGELERVLPQGGTAYLLGGSAAIPDAVANQLEGLGYHVVRYGGADRYATAVAVADALGDPSTVFLASGRNFPDALAAGPAAAHLHGAVLLTDGSSPATATSGYLIAHATTTYAVGGPAAAADPNAAAVFGADRFATAAAVAAKFFPAPTTVGIATGTSFPDALSGGAQLALADSPLLLSLNGGAPSPTTTYLADARSSIVTLHLYGGTSALADAVEAQMRATLGG